MKRRLLVLAMSFIMVFTMMPMMSGAAFAAEGGNTVISEINLIIPEGKTLYPEYGEDYALFESKHLPAFKDEMPTGLNIKIDGWVSHFVKKGSTWKDIVNGVFLDGTYKSKIRINLRDYRDCGYEFAETTTINVYSDEDTLAYTTTAPREIFESDNWARLEFYTEEYTLAMDEGTPLQWSDSNYLTKKITPKKDFPIKGIANHDILIGVYVFGGKAPYTFSKVSGPDWITVDPNTCLVSGTPTEASEKTDLVIRVTDADGNTADHTIEVGEVIAPNIVNRIDITADLDNVAPYVGMRTTDKPVATSVVDNNGNSHSATFSWAKWVGQGGNADEGYLTVSDTIVDIGKWRLAVIVYANGTNQNVFDEDNLKVYVNGEYWPCLSCSPEIYNQGLAPTTYNVTRSDIANATITLGIPQNVEYTGEPVEPTVTVKSEFGNVLTEGIDYTVSYSNNTDIGTATVTVTGIGNYQGSKEAEFTINKGGLGSAVLSTTSYTYNGSYKTPSVTVKDANGKPLTKDTDYTVSYSNNKNIGTATATVTGKGNYSFTKKLTFSIKPKDLASTSKVYVSLCGYDDVKVSWNSVSGAGGYYVYYKRSTSKSYTYAGKTTSTSYKIYNFTDGAKYTFRVYPCVKDGTGKYYKDGSYRTSSEIYMLKKVSSVKAVRSGTKVKVSWSNISGESGYQISRSTKKTGTNIVKTYSTTSGKYYKVSATKGKTYYYKVRAYKTVNGTRIYAPWSTVVKYRR